MAHAMLVTIAAAVLYLLVSIIAAAPSPEPPEPEHFILRLRDYVNTAGVMCGSQSPTPGNDLLLCFNGLRASRVLRARSTVEDAKYLLGCFDPYQSLLEGCTTFARRDSDLALLDAVQAAVANDGELFKALQNHKYEGNCTNPEQTPQFGELMDDCISETGLSRYFGRKGSLDPMEVAEHFCSDASDLKTCLTSFKNSSAPCPESIREADFLLSFYDKIEQQAEHKDEVNKCFSQVNPRRKKVKLNNVILKINSVVY